VSRVVGYDVDSGGPPPERRLTILLRNPQTHFFPRLSLVASFRRRCSNFFSWEINVFYSLLKEAVSFVSEFAIFVPIFFQTLPFPRRIRQVRSQPHSKLAVPFSPYFRGAYTSFLLCPPFCPGR